MNVLIITRSEWDDSNSTGNTISNLFSFLSNDNVSNLYFRAAPPKNKICKKYFSISDKDIIKSLLPPFNKPGKQFILNECKKEDREYSNLIQEKKIYGFFRNRDSVLGLWGQNLLWSIGTWKNKNLRKFLKDEKIDLIFSPSFHTSYTHWVLWYAKKVTGAKVILFHADNYLVKSNVNNKLLNQINERIRISRTKKSAMRADLNYCISELQQKEYEKVVNKKMKILFKGADFTEKPPYIIPDKDGVIKMLYIGSLLYGRWETLSLLAKEIAKINKKKQKFKLLIYSQYEPTATMKEKLVIEGSSAYLGKLSPQEIDNVYRSSDVLLHVESLNKEERELTKMSFSTKIVDLLKSGRTTMVIGWEEAASIDYFKKNDAAIFANSKESINRQLNEIIKKPELLETYANKAWQFGKKNHQIEDIQKNLMKDLELLKILSK